jgi:hypothetical protein
MLRRSAGDPQARAAAGLGRLQELMPVLDKAMALPVRRLRRARGVEAVPGFSTIASIRKSE